MTFMKPKKFSIEPEHANNIIDLTRSLLLNGMTQYNINNLIADTKAKDPKAVNKILFSIPRTIKSTLEEHGYEIEDVSLHGLEPMDNVLQNGMDHVFGYIIYIKAPEGYYVTSETLMDDLYFLKVAWERKKKPLLERFMLRLRRIINKYFKELS